MKFWKKLNAEEQAQRINEALKLNIDYKRNVALGIPASKLDPFVFSDQPFLKDAPLLRTFVANPNHIGCHTLGSSEPFFKGTQALERELIELLSVDLLKADVYSCDGYVASGGTEANIQAAWVYRNYFMQEKKAGISQIALLSSEDTHYSVSKASNLLNIRSFSVPVDENTREIDPERLRAVIWNAKQAGYRYFIVISNMGTTMFGSIDSPDLYAEILESFSLDYKIHVDAAFGGFVYPVSHPENNINFSNPRISSFTLDAHKMLQAPYGTGIFIIRKKLLQYSLTREAAYVSGMDMTLSGSRSGTNAVAVWMILFTYGPYGWLEKIKRLLFRTTRLCEMLDEKGIQYYRHPDMNIVTMRAKYVKAELATEFGLVPDEHQRPSWYKIVMMDHVELDYLESFAAKLEDHSCHAEALK